MCNLPLFHDFLLYFFVMKNLVLVFDVRVEPFGVDVFGSKLDTFAAGSHVGRGVSGQNVYCAVLYEVQLLFFLILFVVSAYY